MLGVLAIVYVVTREPKFKPKSGDREFGESDIEAGKELAESYGETWTNLSPDEQHMRTTEARSGEEYSAGERVSVEDFDTLSQALATATEMKEKVEASGDPGDRQQFLRAVSYGLRDWDFNCPPCLERV